MKKLFLVLLFCLSLIGCSDSDNGGNGDGAAGLDHNELATHFHSALNSGHEASFVLSKSSTIEENFIVLENTSTGEFEAINLSGYDPNSTDAVEFYQSRVENETVYRNLFFLPAYSETEYYVPVERTRTVYNEFFDRYETETYTEYVTRTTEYPDQYRWMNPELPGFGDIVFEKMNETSKDLSKLEALREKVLVEKNTEFLSSKFGLSLRRAKEVATLSAHWKKASKKALTRDENDLFVSEILGFSLSEGLKTLEDGYSEDAINLLVEKAAETNGITPEHAKKIMTKLFSL